MARPDEHTSLAIAYAARDDDATSQQRSIAVRVRGLLRLGWRMAHPGDRRSNVATSHRYPCCVGCHELHERVARAAFIAARGETDAELD
jgi:hypothetical protein